ncbi:MAG: glutamate--tRNA ligase family protein, partial [Thermodesulfobacteriota bacterium]
MAMLRCRIAPTPSGLLHLGNGVNFVICWVLTRRSGGQLRLRIDDGDSGRCRPEYLDDIFRQLEWLGLDWDIGPQGVTDFRANFSQSLRLERYQDLLARLGEHAYECGCSRKEIRARVASGVYPGFCRYKSGAKGPGARRLLVPEGTLVQVGGVAEVDLAAEMGDFILWRRDNSPAYQLASLADDLDHGINLIVRGADLLASSAAQLFLARLLAADSFAAARFVHHDLLTDDQGQKLAKSDKALSLAVMREQGVKPLAIYRAAAPF